MKKTTKEAFRELLKEVRKELKNQDNWYVNHFMPAVGTFQTEEKDCDDNGNLGFVNSNVTISEDEALEQAKDSLLSEEKYFDEFLFESELRDKMLKFMRCVCEEF